jgi:DNA modification methylase
VWEWLMERGTSRADQRILDPFAGSGTSIIAAERLGHRCAAIELDPGYCDVIIRRWETLTRKTATLVPRKEG